MDQEIRPFLIDASEAELADLRGRLRQTRWPGLFVSELRSFFRLVRQPYES